MRLGGGNKHGRLYMGDSVIKSSELSLPDIRARSTASDPPIRQRPTAAQHRIEALELEVEMEANQQAQAQRLEQLTQFLQQSGFALPPGLLAPLAAPPPPQVIVTPPQSVGSNNPPNAPAVTDDENYQGIICLALEKALADESVAPIDLPFWFPEAITDNFSDKQLIGSGGFASVYKGALRNGIVVAVKKLHNKIEVQEKDFQREVACLIDVKHRNIVRFLGYCYETQHKVYQHEGRHVLVDKRNMLFCFEFLSRGSLANFVTGESSGLHWRLRYQIIKGICEGVGYLHQQRIIHMDLKPDNILLDDSMVPRIADFGISRRFSENQSKIITESKVGSLGYMAPEFIKYGRITFKTDIYSLGVIIIEILMGCKECPNVDKVLEGWTSTFGTSKSSQLLEQVKVCAEIGIYCTHDDPSRRPDIQDIICRLNETDISEQHRALILDEYLPHVRRQGRNIMISKRGTRLYSNRKSSGSWCHIDFEHPTTFDTLAMHPNKKRKIMEDLDNFRRNKDYYRRIGKPWKRSYLLFGPPGTGKSTMIAAMEEQRPPQSPRRDTRQVNHRLRGYRLLLR